MTGSSRSSHAAHHQHPVEMEQLPSHQGELEHREVLAEELLHEDVDVPDALAWHVDDVETPERQVGFEPPALERIPETQPQHPDGARPVAVEHQHAVARG